MKQTDKILAYCAVHETITQREAFKLGIYRLASRMYDLGRMGYRILKEDIKVQNADGSFSWITRYSIKTKEDMKNEKTL
jgi:hypothetical protein